MSLIAHRGLTTRARDNSHAAIRSVATAAMKNVPLGIEVDIRRTSDALVLSHDPAEGMFVLSRMTTCELQQELRQAAPITLEEGLSLMGPIPVINLEIKEPGYTASVVSAAMTHLHQYGKSWDSLFISSFLPEVVAEVKEINHHLRTALLIEETVDAITMTESDVLATLRTNQMSMESIERAASLLQVFDNVGADFLNPHWSDLSPALLGGVAARGKHVAPWTVNSEQLLVELSLRAEIGHVITDFPGIVFPELRTKAPTA